MSALVPGDQTVFGNLTVTGNVTSLASRIPTCPFGDLRVTQKENVIDLKSTFGISLLRDRITTAGTGTVTNGVGTPEFVLQIAGVPADAARLRSVARGQYTSGMGAEVGIGVRMDPAAMPTGGVNAQWGYFDDANGFYFGADTSGLYIAYKKQSVETRVYRAAWNTDQMNGAGPSGTTFDPAGGKGIIYQIQFSWYGYGAIVWRIVHTDNVGRQVTVIVHKFAPTNGTSIDNPNLPVSAAVFGTAAGTGSTCRIYVAGRQFSVLGHVRSPIRRSTMVYALGSVVTSGLWRPVMSFRRKAAYVGNPVSVGSIDLTVTSSCVYQLRSGSVLVGTNFGAVPDTVTTETALEVDTSATTGTGGVVIYGGLVTSSCGKNVSSFTSDEITFSMTETDTVSLFIYTYSGNMTVDSAVRMVEGW